MPRSKSDTKARARAVARELFLANGVQRTSLQDIADRLGVSKPALYYHFASREDLVRSVVEPLFEDGSAFVERAERGGMAPREVLAGYFEFQYRHREVVALMVQELTSLRELDLLDHVWDWRRRLTALLVGPEPSLTDAVNATVALGGLADCVLVFPDTPYDELCAAGVEAACATLGI